MEPLQLDVTTRGCGVPDVGRGHVFSVHSGSLNLTLDSTPNLVSLVCDRSMLTVTSLVVGRSGAIVRLDALGAEPGTPAVLARGRLELGPDVSIDLLHRGAGGFDGRIAPWDHDAPTGRLGHELARRVSRVGGGRGFGSIAAESITEAALGAGSSGRGDPVPGGASADPFARAAGSIVRRALERAATSEDAALIELGALIGLGIGFTPSGDDFLVGALAARAVLGRGPASQEVLRSLAARADRTTLPGATIVRQALADASPAYLCDLAAALGAAALAAARNANSMREAIAGAANHGATSGIDAMAGLAFGLVAWSYTRSRSAVFR